MKKRIPIRLQFTFYLTILLGGIFIVLELIFLKNLEEDLIQNKLHELKNRSIEFQTKIHSLKQDQINYEKEELQELYAGIEHGQYVFFKLFDPEGFVVYQNYHSISLSDAVPNIAPPSISLQKSNDHIEEGYLVYENPIFYLGKKYTVQVFSSLSSINKFIHKSSNLLNSIFLSSIFIAGFVMWFISKLLLQPFRKIAFQAKNPNNEMDQYFGSDEVATLSHILKNSFKNLKMANQHIQQFTGDVSHELRTPLTVLRGDIEVCLRRPRQSQEYKEVLQNNLKMIGRIESIVKSLLMIAKCDDKKQKMNYVSIGLHQLIERRFKQCSKMFPKDKMQIENNVEPSFKLIADAEQISIVIDNLIINAFKYSGKESVLLKVFLRKEANIMKLVFEDDGDGIEEEYVERVFDRFFRADDVRTISRSGIGLGLSLCKKIMSLHNGEIQLSSQRGRGTEVTLIFNEQNQEMVA